MRSLALLLLLIAVPARADDMLRLAPTPDALHRERTADLEQRLARMVAALSEVAHAEVQLALPATYAEPLDAPAALPRVTVLLTRHAPGPSLRDDVFRVVRSSVSDLTPDGLTLIERTEQGPRETLSLVHVGPFRVHSESAEGLRLWLAISLVANALLATIVLSRLRGNPPAARKVDPRARSPIPP